MEPIPIPTPNSGGLILSYQCPAKCRHCLYACSPKWKGDWISEEDLKKGLSGLAGKIRSSTWGPKAIGVNEGLHFSGGEPFLNFDLLVKAASLAEEMNIPSTFVETNCFWCLNDKETKDKLKILKKAGLKGIMISVNPYYAEFVPFERTRRGIEMALKVFGRNVIVYQLEFFRLFSLLGIEERLPLEEFLERTPKTNWADRVELFLMGRAAIQLQNRYPAFPAEHFFKQSCLMPFLRGWHNHFDNYGNYLPGFCGGISLGNWLEMEQLLAEGLDPEKMPILGFLIREDLEGLFNFARDLGYEESPEGYCSRCHLCLDLRRYLNGKGDFPELRPKEFYEHLE
jgi:hypothetical protein